MTPAPTPMRSDDIGPTNPDAGVESEPSEPQQAGAQDRHRELMRSHVLFAVAQTLFQHNRASQRRDARTDVHDGSAGKIQRAQISEPSPDRPDPVREGIVNERG